MSKTLPRCDLDGNQFVRASLRHPTWLRYPQRRAQRLIEASALGDDQGGLQDADSGP